MAYEWKFNSRPYSDEEAKRNLHLLFLRKLQIGIIIPITKGMLHSSTRLNQSLRMQIVQEQMEITVMLVN